MKDCGCQKEDGTKNWVGENEVGDDFLFEEGTNMIKSIERNIVNSKVNRDAIFNKKLDEDQLSTLILDDTVIDYSYIEGDDDTLVNYEVDNINDEEDNINDDDENNINDDKEDNINNNNEEDNNNNNNEEDNINNDDEEGEDEEETEGEDEEETEGEDEEETEEEGETETEDENVNENETEDDYALIKETEEEKEDDTDYQQQVKYSSKREAEKYLNDLL